MTDAARKTGRMGSPANAVETWAWPTPWIESPDRAEGVGSRHTEATPLSALYAEKGASPWLGQLTRKGLVSGRLSRMVEAGIRGVTADRDILASALETSPEYAEQLSWLLLRGCTLEEAYWELAATDVQAACAVLRPVYQESQAEDGYVSVDISPSRARSAAEATTEARRLHHRIDRPNLLVGIPATPRGVSALQATVAAGRNTNATSISSVRRYSMTVDAYLAGLETFVEHGGDPATVHGVASFCLGPVSAGPDRRLTSFGDSSADALRDHVAIGEAGVAYRLFAERFSSERWERLCRRGANPQRLLWMCPGTASGAGARRTYVAPNTISAFSESEALSMTCNGLSGDPHDIDVPEIVPSLPTSMLVRALESSILSVP